MDATVLGQLAAEMMEVLAEVAGDGTEIRLAAVAVELDDGESTSFAVRATDDRAWVLQHFLFEVSEDVGLWRDRRRQISEADGE